MLNKKIIELLNDQVNKELYSAYLYLDIADYYANEGLDGFANWYEVQAREEQDHALMFRRYHMDNGTKIELKAIDKPDKVFKDHTAPLEIGFAHEQYVTSLITAIYNEAHTQKDYRTMQFLDWFIKEQAEEETNAEEMIKKMNLFGNNSMSLYSLNKELAARVYAPSKTGPAM